MSYHDTLFGQDESFGYRYMRVNTNELNELPLDVLKRIASNLDAKSFFTFSSTCHYAHQLEDDLPLVRHVCKIDNIDTTLHDCKETLRIRNERKKGERIQQEKQAFERNGKISRDLLWCGRRLATNSLLEWMAVVTLLVASITGPLAVDRVSLLKKTTGWLLLLPTFVYGIVPYIQLYLGQITQCSNWTAKLYDPNIFTGPNSIYNQEYLWSKKQGFKPVRHVFVVFTWILVMLWCYDIIDLNYSLIPLLIVSLIYSCIRCINCNIILDKDDCGISINQVLLVPIGILFTIGLLLLVLRSFAIIPDFYSLCVIPITIAVMLLPYIRTTQACLVINSCCSSSTIDETVRLDVFMPCCESLFTTPLYVVFITLLTIVLDGYRDYSFVCIFIPLWIIIIIRICFVFPIVMCVQCFNDKALELSPDILPVECTCERSYCCCEDNETVSIGERCCECIEAFCCD